MSRITPAAFTSKWRHVQLTERSASQQQQVLEFPGSASGPWARYVSGADASGVGTVRYPRLVPRDEQAAVQISKRTLTNLYNQCPAWLDLAHWRLDDAVFDAYGWDSPLSDEDILERLLQLNTGLVESTRA